MANYVYVISEKKDKKEIARFHTPEDLARYIISDLWSKEKFYDHPSFQTEEFKETIDQESFYDNVSEDFSVSGNVLLSDAANSVALSYRQKALDIASDIIVNMTSRDCYFYIDSEIEANVLASF